MSDFNAFLPAGKAGGYNVGLGVGERWISKVGAH